MRLPFHNADPAHRDFQYLEDLSTAYWYSEALFASLELKLFEALERGRSSPEELAGSASCGKDELLRLLKALERLELVHRDGERWFNSQVARLYLAPGNQTYMGDFLLYRRHMQPKWMDLAQRVSGKTQNEAHPTSHDDDYKTRTLQYVRAMDQLARQKAEEITAVLNQETWRPPILDVGGGAAALSRSLIRTTDTGCATLFELPDALAAAQALYPDKGAWERIHLIAGDFRTYEFEAEARFGLVLLSNFLHAYGAVEAREALRKSLALLDPDGLILIHDYFPDRLGRSPGKGPLYDLNMMLNTYNGRCHDASEVMKWLRDDGIARIRIRDLSTDSSIILAGGNYPELSGETDLEEWVYMARSEGFHRGVLIPTDKVTTASWVRMKCQSGCPGYGSNLQCPPHGMDHRATREMLGSYTWAILLEGTPPGLDFHRKLLRMEKRAFLAGFHKAFALGAGPCPVCERCPEEGLCRYPGQARPSMEGSGIDVYTVASEAGIHLKPVTSEDQHVKYIGLLLLE
jgi:predicted metal-binding protein